MRNPNPQEKYVEATFGLKSAELMSVRAELIARDVDFMSISSAEARTLQFFIRSLGLKKIVEIGTLFGYSALAMAEVLPEDGQVYTLEKNPENWNIAKQFFAKSANAKKITSLCGDAVELTQQIERDGPFDLVFIDANKPGYLGYLEWADKNVRPGGLIVGDNTFLFGAFWGESRDLTVRPDLVEKMLEFNRRLADPKHYNSMIVPTTEGMTVAQKL